MAFDQNTLFSKFGEQLLLDSKFSDQKVVVDCSSSESARVKSGVPRVLFSDPYFFYLH